MYVPALKWRTGEYQAIFRLSDAAKNRIAPLFMIPPIEFDFETWSPKHTVQEHVSPFAKRYNAKWKTRHAWVDVDSTLQAAKMDNRHKRQDRPSSSSGAASALSLVP
jgi:hypothetical protein